MIIIMKYHMIMNESISINDHSMVDTTSSSTN